MGWGAIGSIACAATTINVGNYLLLPNTPGQVISIPVVGGDAAPGADLAVQIGDGGPEMAMYGQPAGTPGPKITGIGLTTGTIFGVSGASQFTPSGNIPQVWFTNVALLGTPTSVSTSGVLANITIDTTGFSNGSFPLLLKNVVPGLNPPNGMSSDFTDSGPVPTINNGAVLIIPAAAYWMGSVDGNWSTNNSGASNWRTDAGGATDTHTAPGIASDVFFTTTSGATNLGTSLDTDFSIKGLTFTSAATSPVSIGGNHTLTLGVDGLTLQNGAATATIGSPVALGASQTWSVTGANPLVVNGAVSVPAARALTKAGSGTLRINTAPSLGNGSSLAVTAGTMRIGATTGSATIGTSVTATVSPTATLELAGSVSALSAGSNRVNITNSSQAAAGGVFVSGSNQQVGGIDGGGNTVVGDGASLTANHIVQNALVIGGASSSPTVVILAASDNNGNPLANVAGDSPTSPLRASGLVTSAPVTAQTPLGTTPPESSLSAAGRLSDLSLAGATATVPEPATISLLAFGGAFLTVLLLRLNKRR